MPRLYNNQPNNLLVFQSFSLYFLARKITNQNMPRSCNNRGFTLIEILVGVAIFVLFAVGIYSGIQFVFKVVYNSRLQIIETGILNEQVEMVRNLSFYDVGIVNGSPSGILDRTVTTTRNGIDFTITRTIRNIDDPYDGVIGGDPNDTAPADYKLVEIEIICDNCGQRKPKSMLTYVAPRYLEGDPAHGALFIEVIDANAEPVQGATVHVVASTTDPTYDFYDTTDNEGMLRVVDLAAGIGSYHLTITKDGYVSDGTTASSEELPNPTKPPASVEAQSANTRTFEIDLASSINLSTINSLCTSIASVPVNIVGTKLLGTDPGVFIVDEAITTDGSGSYSLANLVWDSYGFVITGYDLIGSIPNIPLSLPAGMDQTVQLVLGSNTANSLLLSVTDSINGQPLSDAIVTVTSTSYNETKTTGVGHISQTDWSGGAGQLEMSNETRYWSDDGNLEVDDPAGDITLTLVGEYYVGSGWLESSIYDLGLAASYVNLNWSSFSQPAETGDDSVRFQVATSNTSTPPSWDYLGPDGTAGTYYDTESVEINEIHDGDRYFRYKLYLQTASTTYTPTISGLSLSYTNSCMPPGQVYFGSLTTDEEYTIQVTRTGYQTRTESITAGGDIIFGMEMVVE